MSHVPDDVASVFEQDDSGESHAHPTLEALEDSTIRRHDGKAVGTVYYCPDYDCNAYFSKRWEQKHKYRKGNAYPLDVCIIEELQEEWDVEKIFIGLRRERSVLEFDFEQYEDGEFINHENPQLYESVENCRQKWENALDSIIAE